MTRQRGRPRKLLAPGMREQVYEVLRHGGSRSDAAARVGVTRETIRAEAQRDGNFLAGLLQAESEGKLALVLLVRRGAKDDWRAAAWMLERKWPKEWSKRKPA